MTTDNPYDWSAGQPQVLVPRDPIVEQVTRQLRAGRGTVLLGGRGIGKSVLLNQIQERFAHTEPAVKLVLFRSPPIPLSIETALRSLARALDVAAPFEPDAGALLDRYFAAHPEVRTVALLYDELDQYAEPLDGASIGRALFNHLEAVRKERKGRLSILAAGGLGVFVLRDVLGSVFLSRALWLSLEPFTEEELLHLARPFAERQRPLRPEVLKAIYLSSGGNPALATYGLENLWDRPDSNEQHVSHIYAGFKEAHPEFLRSFHKSLVHSQLSAVPAHVWARVQRGDGRIPRQELLDACRVEPGKLSIDLDDVLRLLRSAGLIQFEGPKGADPVLVRSVPSILNLPE